MEGPVHSNMQNLNSKLSENVGILPRTAIYLQNEINRYQKEFKKDISYEVSALEIYCENIRDLFQNEEQNAYLELKNYKNKIVCPG